MDWLVPRYNHVLRASLYKIILYRLINDSSEVAAIIAKIDSSIPESSILDCTRLGAYNNDRNRPILAKLSRTCEVSSILLREGVVEALA